MLKKSRLISARQDVSPLPGCKDGKRMPGRFRKERERFSGRREILLRLDEMRHETRLSKLCQLHDLPQFVAVVKHSLQTSSADPTMWQEKTSLQIKCKWRHYGSSRLFVCDGTKSEGAGVSDGYRFFSPSPT